jgi:hypothetical protein
MILKEVWSNGVTNPIEWRKARSLHLALPSFRGGVIHADTTIGYDRVDLKNYMDGIHKRIALFVVLGFGVVFKTEWNCDGIYGRYK